MLNKALKKQVLYLSDKVSGLQNTVLMQAREIDSFKKDIELLKLSVFGLSSDFKTQTGFFMKKIKEVQNEQS